MKGVKAAAEEIEVRLAVDLRRGDEQIAACMLDRLSYDTLFPRGAVEAEVAKGRITLSGQVPWFYLREAAGCG